MAARVTPSRQAARSGLDIELLARRGLLLVAAAAALTGVLAGLTRLGIVLGWAGPYGLSHGPLLVLGVFATLIGLERAIALAKRWAFAAPVAGAIAAVAMLARMPWVGVAASAASAALIGVNVAIVRKQAAAFTWLMLLGSVVLFLGSLAWALGRPVFDVVPTWIAFFVLTIGAERLELSRLAPTPSWAKRTLVGLNMILALSACAALAWSGPWTRLVGVSLVLLGAWQLRFDVARQTVRQHGLPRFSATAILLGAAWLVGGGVLLARSELPPAGPLYDAILHAVFVGYVLSMIFAHAPIILPAVARVQVPFHPVLWVPLVVLHLGLSARIAGDLTLDGSLRQIGASANAAALVVFVLAVVWARRSRNRSRSAASFETRAPDGDQKATNSRLP